jgi:beta-lactamase superfamily II metal-dependent hydrolase
MEVPIRFPNEGDKIYEEAVAFRQLSPEQRTSAILDLISVGAWMMQESPHREAIARLQQAHEDAWQKAQRELFARLGV